MNEVLVKDRSETGHNGLTLVPTDTLAITKNISNADLIKEEHELQKSESDAGKDFGGIHGYLRLFQVSRVIAMLSLYLYLDQWDIHKRQIAKQKKERMTRAVRLTRMAVYGEYLYSVRGWFFTTFIIN